MASTTTDTGPQKRAHISEDEPAATYPDTSSVKDLILQTRRPDSSGKPAATHPESSPARQLRFQEGSSNPTAPKSSSGAAAIKYHTPKVMTDSDSDISPPDPRFTQEKRGAINDFLERMQDDLSYYGILGLPDYAEGKLVSKAYKRLALKLHSNNNGFKEAKPCFARIQTSYEVLGDPDRKARYDASLRKVAKLGRRAAADKSGGIRIEEAFNDNAWGLEQDDEPDLSKHKDESDGENDVEDVQVTHYFPPPSEAINEALKQMGHDVAIWATSRDKDARASAKKRIKKANEQVRQANAESGIPEPTYTFKNDGIESIFVNFGRMQEKLRIKDTARLAQGLGEAVIRNFEALGKLPQNQWPVEWTDSIVAAVSEAHARRGYQFREPRAIAPREPVQEDVIMLDSPETSRGIARQPDTKDTIMLDARDSLLQTPRSSGLLYSSRLKPGYTRDGRRILGYRGWFSVDARGELRGRDTFDPALATLTRIQFIIKGYTGGIELLAAWAAGSEVRDAYFQQPLSKQYFVPNSLKEVQEPIPTPTRVVAYASYHGRKRVPDGVALCEAETGGRFLISLNVMRLMFERTRLDAAIGYIVERQRQPPWRMQVDSRRRLEYHQEQPQQRKLIGGQQGWDDSLTDDSESFSDDEASYSDYGELGQGDKWGSRGVRKTAAGERTIRGLIGDMGRRLRL